MYYKLLEKSEVIQVFNNDIDDFLDMKNRFGDENVEEIDKDEYTKYKNKFDKMDADVTQPPQTILFTTVGDVLDAKKGNEVMDLKLYIFDSFFQNQYDAPQIQDLEDYYNWLRK